MEMYRKAYTGGGGWRRDGGEKGYVERMRSRRRKDEWAEPKKGDVG